ncbi:hypothetical protein RIF29_42070 [Crotalaria pallida]|uniref:Glycosyltransferase n=1 Tax=Crotalaria pallida TaxID=3830 RepID=A0AAN9E955_CROPI
MLPLNFISSSKLISYHIMEKNTCIVMVPCPGLSHLIPLVEFAKRLVQHDHHKLHVTFLIPSLGPPSSSMMAILNDLPPDIDFTILNQINIEDLPQNIHPAPKMRLTVKLSIPFLHEAVSSLSSRTHLVALVFDMFSVDAIDVAKQFNLLSYVFFASGATTLSFCLSLPKLHESVSFTEVTKTVNVPGCVVPFQVKDLPDPLPCESTSENLISYVDICRILSLVDGLIVNSFLDLESGAIRALQVNENSPRVYPVGPIIQIKSASNENQWECIEWLNKHPPKSVLYVSFGSGGTLSQDQLNELAFGLELSGHKFLWVVRAPNNSPSSAYLIGQKEDQLNYLPSGFLDRTKGRGLVVSSWAPQIEVLGHGSTGAFLSHCGWNSILESVVCGMPMIVWPLFAEQRMNAVTVTEVLKVAVKPKVDDESGIIKREEIVKVIKRIMEGDQGFEIRKRIKDLSDAAGAALREHGSSRRALSSLVLKWQKI